MGNKGLASVTIYWAMANSIMAMYLDLGAPLAPWVFATDAMGSSSADSGGFGIVVPKPSNLLLESLRLFVLVLPRDLQSLHWMEIFHVF